MGAAGRARATLSPNCPKLLDAHRGLLERVQLANIERVAAEALGSRHASFEQELPRRCQLALELITLTTQLRPWLEPGFFFRATADFIFIFFLFFKLKLRFFTDFFCRRTLFPT